MNHPTLHLVKAGGKIVDDHSGLEACLVAFDELPFPKILVHGGGKKASEVSHRLGIKTHMVAGRRITNASTLEVAVMVYAGLVNKQIVAKMQAIGMNAVGMTGADADCIRCVIRPVGKVDFGLVGDIQEVRHGAFMTMLSAGQVPVIAPITHDGMGQLLNTNADTIASAVASALTPFFTVHLAYCFEFKGVLKDPALPDGESYATIRSSELGKLTDSGCIHTGMLPKLFNAVEASRSGVADVRICCPSNLVCKTGSTKIEWNE